MIKNYLRRHVWWRVLIVYCLMAVLFSVPIKLRLIRDQQTKAHALAAQQIFEEAPKPPKKVVISGQPVRIVFPTLGVDLPIEPGAYDPSTQQWNVSLTGANFATNTQPVNNDKGATLIYGHYYQRIFGKTKNLIKGDRVLVYTDNNHTISYIFDGSVLLNPNDTALFSKLDGIPRLMVMTCEGVWAENRRLMTFQLERAI